MSTNGHTGELFIQLMSSTFVTEGPEFSCQKEILDRRLAETDGLSSTSFRTDSVPPTVRNSLRAVWQLDTHSKKKHWTPAEQPVSVYMTSTSRQDSNSTCTHGRQVSSALRLGVG